MKTFTQVLYIQKNQKGDATALLKKQLEEKEKALQEGRGFIGNVY